MTDLSQDAPRSTTMQIRFGGGVTQGDRARVDEATRRLVDRLARQEPGSVDAELSVKDRDGRDMRTTLEVWVTGLPRMVATSDQPDLDSAVGEVADRILSRFDSVKTRREPRNNRTRRDSIRLTEDAPVPQQ